MSWEVVSPCPGIPDMPRKVERLQLPDGSHLYQVTTRTKEGTTVALAHVPEVSK